MNERQYYYLVAAVIATLSSCLSLSMLPPNDAMIVVKWSLAQWMPFPLRSIGRQWQNEAWNHWENQYHDETSKYTTKHILQMPSVQVQDFSNAEHLLRHLIEIYGEDWRKRPLLLQNLWSREELEDPPQTRRLSKAGLLKENLTIPYFKDARIVGALTPNGEAPIQDIIANITLRKAPHKIGSQLLVQTYPELIYEIAPNDIVTTLFGNHFQPNHVKGFLGLPALTTVPFFVAGTSFARKEDSQQNNTTNRATQTHPFTALHCEPIGNVAVQLQGEKHWTLVSPHHSFRMKPSSSPDGRAFYVSQHASEEELGNTPHYATTTAAGDALWIPTWTWHRVDYASRNTSTEEQEDKDQIAIGASLFHLRPVELVKHNPLFAFLAIPNLIKEVLRLNTQ